MQVKALDHIHIYSLNPAASIAFWEKHFGAKKVFETKNEHHQAVLIYQVGTAGLAFSEYPPGKVPAKAEPVGAAEGREGMSRGGVMHLGVNVEDVKAAVAELKAAGAKVHTEPAVAYGVTFAYVEAPDGVMLELTQY
jgi:catechol 2,3-dioxygenase-like lactoylglutathione lyase family enzyme